MEEFSNKHYEVQFSGQLKEIYAGTLRAFNSLLGAKPTTINKIRTIEAHMTTLLALYQLYFNSFLEKHPECKSTIYNISQKYHIRMMDDSLLLSQHDVTSGVTEEENVEEKYCVKERVRFEAAQVIKTIIISSSEEE